VNVCSHRHPQTHVHTDIHKQSMPRQIIQDVSTRNIKWVFGVLHYLAVCCSALQSVAACCSVLRPSQIVQGGEDP